MHFPDKSIVKKIIIVLSVVAVITVSAYVAVIHFNNRFQRQLDTEVSNDFLAFIESGNLDGSLDVWSYVYTSKKDNQEFLESFSNALYTKYSEYYKQIYINKTEHPNLHEICRIYYDFINKESFNEVMTLIYDDFYNEIIDYNSFITAENDFYALSKLESSNIPDLLNEASFINESRNTYLKAIETASSEDYSGAIELMRLVSPKDTIYYPKAIEKIDEYILILREIVKNGS